MVVRPRRKKSQAKQIYENLIFVSIKSSKCRLITKKTKIPKPQNTMCLMHNLLKMQK